ncbi:hypothetical protein FRB90_011140 [Tulasnella sp. 427]|nr:hypothetical protein FRB90_011140 [Tulasnella sp. 427]
MPSAALKPPPSAPSSSTLWSSPGDDLDDDGWQDMPIVRAGDNPLGLDEEDEKRFHYVPPEKISGGNATGNILDYDNSGHEWREKLEQNEADYTRLRLDDDQDADEAYLRTKYLFDEDKAMTPLSQMQQTKNLLTEAQRIAYVGLCALTMREMIETLKKVGSKELKAPIQAMELWSLRIMGRLYYHMELETAEQKMIESLAEHGVCAMDLVPALMTTHTVRNPEYDPEEAAQKEIRDREIAIENEKEGLVAEEEEDDITVIGDTLDVKVEPSTLSLNDLPTPTTPTRPPETPTQTTANVLQPTAPVSMPGVSTSLSTTDENVTLDIRWTVLCDLFLLLIADSVYDARSRVLLENVAAKIGLGWLDVVKFEKRVTDALEIQEGIEKLEQKEVIEGRDSAAKKKRYLMVGLATIGGGLVIGLSAGVLAPVIGAGLGAALGTVGISGTTAFLTSTAGAAVITTSGALTGSRIAGKGMARRTQQVRTFELLPLHNNKRVNCILTVPGFMSSAQDDVRLPFSVLDPVVGDVFSVLWEPEMMGETGNALKILTTEVLTQVSTTVLQATAIAEIADEVLTKLGYLIDNPWSNALDRSVAAGKVLADVLIQRHLGVRPITLIGFSLGARVIFYALLELAKQNAFGIVQDVFLLGATVTAPTKTWHEVRGAVSGRFVNGYARNDWILNYLFRATSGGLNTVAGLRPVENVPGLENVDVTDKISGHMSYRVYMPVILDQLAGFDFQAIGKALGKEDLDPNKIKMPVPTRAAVPPVINTPLERSESAPIPAGDGDQTPKGSPRMARVPLSTSQDDPAPSDPPPRFTRSVTSNASGAEPVSGHWTSASLSSANSSYKATSWSASDWSPADDLPALPMNGGGFSKFSTGTSSFGYPLSAPAREPALSFGGMDGSISRYGAPAAGPTLSFGAVDGSISATSLADPWSVSSSKDDKKTSSWNPNNPWG